MKDEKLDIFDEEGKFIGTEYKSIAHRKGLWHKAAHIWIYNSKGQLLLQKRAKNKDTHPRLWDISAAGHVSSGEKPIDSALRELYEELGIKLNVNDLKEIRIIKASGRPKPNRHNQEFDYVYLLKLNIDVNKLNLQKKEIESVKFFDLDKLERDLKDEKENKKYVPHGQYFFDMINLIRKLSKPL